MFPPRDPTRRRFLAVAAIASAVGAGSLAAAARAPNDVPQAVTVPIGPDPIYAVIEAHRKAAREHIAALDIHCAFEECGMQGEKLQEYERLVALTDVAWVAMADAGCTLVNTKPTTLAGILALCRYIEPLLGEIDQPDLPEYIDYDDDTQAYIPEAFAYVIGRAIEEGAGRKGGAVVNIVKFPYDACRAVHSRKPRRSKNGTPEERAARAATIAAGQVSAPVIDLSDRSEPPSRPVRIMTGAQWEEFINALEPEQRQTFMVQVYKTMHRYCSGKA
jgi:hypothetical protein